MKPFLILSLVLFALTACREEEETAEAPVRGMKAHLVTATPNVETRRFPAVLEPSEITSVSFESPARFRNWILPSVSGLRPVPFSPRLIARHLSFRLRPHAPQWIKRNPTPGMRMKP